MFYYEGINVLHDEYRIITAPFAMRRISQRFRAQEQVKICMDYTAFTARYVSFNMLHSHTATHIEGLNMHGVEGAIHTARDYFSWRRLQCILIHQYLFPGVEPYVSRPMSRAMHILVQYIATMCASNHIASINMSEDRCPIHVGYSISCPAVGATMCFDCDNMDVLNTSSAYCNVWCIASDKT